MTRWFHVTSTANRDSIRLNGLDWTRMATAPGIAGSHAAEEAGVFVCRDESEVDFFALINNTGGSVDVWEITGVDESQLLTSGSGFCYLPATIGPGRLTLIETRAQPVDPDDGHDHPLDRASSAYRSGLTITLDDGRVLRDADRVATERGASVYPAVGVVAYDPSWPARYLQLSRDLRAALGSDWLIEHIGSTSVPGLAAKPVIDLAVRVPLRLDLHAKTKDLVAVGWTTPVSIGAHDCSFVLDGNVRMAIAHFFTASQWPTAHQRLFSAWLRTHPEDRDSYADLKQQLHRDGLWGQAYTRAKTDFVQAIVDQARFARGLSSIPVWDKD